MPGDACEMAEFNFAPDADFFFKLSKNLKDTVFMEYLRIRKLDGDYNFPRDFWCLTINTFLKFILLYESCLVKYPESPYAYQIKDHFEQISSYFMSFQIFWNRNRNIDEAFYNEIVEAYNSYLSQYPNGLLAERISNIQQILDQNKDNIFQKSSEEGKRNYVRELYK